MGLLLTSDIGFHELCNFLEIEGHRVKVCRLKDAPVVIEQYPVDVVLLDWGQKMAEGLQTLRELKVNHPEIPVIVLADSSSEETAIDAFRLGAKDYFRKPVNVLELQEVLKNLLKLRSTSRERRFPYLTRNGVVSSLLVTATTSMSPGILRVISHMAENLSNNISLKGLAREAGMSRYHLCRGFKKVMGMSLMQFLAAMRVERAKKLLRESSLSISMVALEVGFNDLSNFIKHFKKITGSTPTAYKKSL